MVFLFSPRRGTLTRFSGLEEVSEMPGVRVVHAAYDEGDRVGGDHEEIFVANIWMQAADAAAAVRAYRNIAKTVRIDVR